MNKSAADLVRETRLRAGLTQSELAERVRTTQSVISAYESGRREPTVPTLDRLIRAAGAGLHLEARPARVRPSEQLKSKRAQVLEIAQRRGLSNLRLFGSLTRGEDRDDSDIDLLVDLPPDATLWTLGAAKAELSSLLGSPVDLVPATDLKPGVKERVLAEAIPL